MPKLSASQLQTSASASVTELADEPAKLQEVKLQTVADQQSGEPKKQAPSYDNDNATSARDDAKTGRVDSFDHVTFWVGNARQAAVFYMTQLGFEPLAFRGLETGSRDVACHVLRLNETIIQLVSPVEPNNRELGEFLASHGDAVKDVAFRVENIEDMLKHALDNGAELVKPLEVLTFDEPPKATPGKWASDRADESAAKLARLVMKRATIRTFGDITHTFIERNYDYEPALFLPGYHKPSLEVSNETGELASELVKLAR